MTDVPAAWHPTRLRVHLSRFACTADGCRRQSSGTYQPGGGAEGVEGSTQDPATIGSRVSAAARALELGWKHVNTLAGSLTRRLISDRPGRLDEVRFLGVDEKRVEHRRSQRDPDLVTVVHLAPVIGGTGPHDCWTWWRTAHWGNMPIWLVKRDSSFCSRLQFIVVDGSPTVTTGIWIPSAPAPTNGPETSGLHGHHRMIPEPRLLQRAIVGPSSQLHEMSCLRTSGTDLSQDFEDSF